MRVATHKDVDRRTIPIPNTNPTNYSHNTSNTYKLIGLLRLFVSIASNRVANFIIYKYVIVTLTFVTLESIVV